MTTQHKDATCSEAGYTGDTWCTDCNKKVAEGKNIEKLEHKPVLVMAEDATAAKEGNIKHYYCENCGKYYSDEAGTKEITKEDTVVSKLAPKIIDGNNAKIDKSSKEPVFFRSDAAFADFIRVEVDGKELVKDKDYTQYVFETNSRGKLLADDVSYAYIYRINGDKLILDFTENVVRDCEYTFSVDGAKLTLKGGTGTDGGTYSLNKK